MNSLIDTCAFLWFIEGDDGLSAAARHVLDAAGERRYLSIVSVWEIGIKVGLGRLDLHGSLDTVIAAAIEANEMELLPITVTDIACLTKLPYHHRDPFDRLLAAQCLTSGWRIVSRDRIFDAYGVERVW